MRFAAFCFLLASSLSLAGCSALHSPGGRITFLVLVPMVLIAGLVYLLFRGKGDRLLGRGPSYPDFDDHD